MSLLKQLVEKGLLDKDKAGSAEFEIKESGEKEEEVILKKGLVSEKVLFDLKGEVLKIPVKEVEAKEVPLKTLELIPEETAKYYQMIPLHLTEKYLEIGMVYPEDFKAQEALKFLARQGNFDYRVYLISITTFGELLKQYKNLKKEVGTALEELGEDIAEDKMGTPAISEFERMAEEAPITKIVDVIMRHALEGNASDIHIEPTREKLRVRFRTLGVLHPSIFLPLNVRPAIIARIKILSSLKIDEMRIPQDGRFSVTIEGRPIDFRVSTFPTVFGEKAAIRVLDPEVGLKKFSDLGMDDRNVKTIEDAIKRPFGLILSTGPTGSGKTTTLNAILQTLNKEAVNVVTLEDPVEYYIDGINQSQIKPEIGYSFATGLRHILRQDPNTIMVGEIRDEETASMVIHATLTGHIVLSSLHTSNARGVIPRLIDMGVKPYLIPPTLRVAIAQRLIRRLCDNCKKAIKPSKEVREMLQKEIDGMPPKLRETVVLPKDLQIFTPQGCSKCNNTGFTGRIALFEVLSMTDQLADIILKEISEARIEEEAIRQGMVTMEQDGILKVLSGLTTLEEILRVAEEK
jgi:type IV pilus assembly protein PilB